MTGRRGRRGRRPHCWQIVGLSIILLFLAGRSQAATFCAREGIKSVLRCYSLAYAARDTTAFAALLAPDCVSFDRDHPNAPPIDRAGMIAETKSFLVSENVTKLNLVFGEGYQIIPGEDPGTWILSEIPVTLVIDGTTSTGKSGSFTINDVVSFWVRAVADPEAHFQIFREETGGASEDAAD